MGHIKEPDGVDFEINSRKLTKEEENAISEFIKNYKSKSQKKLTIRKRNSRRTLPVKKVSA